MAVACGAGEQVDDERAAAARVVGPGRVAQQAAGEPVGLGGPHRRQLEQAPRVVLQGVGGAAPNSSTAPAASRAARPAATSSSTTAYAADASSNAVANRSARAALTPSTAASRPA